jgi:succinate dehydrogenase / fumarate reductase cytochrome b subunit
MPPVRARPLSPHLEIYRWQISNTLSILHRITGVALSVGFLAFVYWLMALAGDGESYASVVHVFGSALGITALVALTFAFFYHLLNGVRHLVWDVGFGFERSERRASGWAVVIGALILTLGVWAIYWSFERG